MDRIIKGKIEFIYHNVGQGLFYSGEIKLENNTTFRFIYDCGSKNTQLVNTSIRRFKQDFGDDEIDLLVISHLHSDHISGLNELFNNFVIKDVILPYFTPIQRLLIAARRINMPLWYYEFLSDPVKYLIEKGVERVIIMGGKEGGKGNIPSEEISPFSPEREKLSIDKLPDDEELRKEIKHSDEDWIKYIDSNKVLIKNHNGYIKALNLWLLRFFNYKITLSKLQQFNSCVNQVVGNRDIKDVIKNKNSLKKLKRCYYKVSKQLRKDFNNTSLVLYHGPIKSNYIDAHSLNYCVDICLFCCPFLNDCRGFFEYNYNKFGQFLTGDIDLNTKYNDLIRHYTHYLKNVIITQVPHHGAIKNWNKRIINDIPDTELWVISAGLTNRYGHPSWRVIGDLCFNGKKGIWVNEINYLRIKGVVTW